MFLVRQTIPDAEQCCKLRLVCSIVISICVLRRLGLFRNTVFAVCFREFPGSVYWREGFWLQGMSFPPHYSGVHVPGWRFHAAEWNGWQEHLWREIRRWKLPNCTCKTRCLSLKSYGLPHAVIKKFSASNFSFSRLSSWLNTPIKLTKTSDVIKVIIIIFSGHCSSNIKLVVKNFNLVIKVYMLCNETFLYIWASVPDLRSTLVLV